MTDKKITTTESIGEIRKATRMFEAFSHAQEVIEFLIEEEKYKKNLENEISSAEKEVEDLKNLISNAKIEAATNHAKVKEIKISIDKLLKEAENTKQAIIADSTRISNQIIEKNKVEIDSLRNVIAQLKSDKNAVENETTDKRKELVDIKNQIALEKSRIVKAFGG